MVLVAVFVVAVAGLAVYRLHGIFGSNHNTSTADALSDEIVPFNPKHVVLEVFGPPGTVATISIQPRPSSRPTENLCTRQPFDMRHEAWIEP